MTEQQQFDTAQKFFDEIRPIMQKHKIEALSGIAFLDRNFLPFKLDGFDLTTETNNISTYVFQLNAQIAAISSQGLTPVVRAKENNLPILNG